MLLTDRLLFQTQNVCGSNQESSSDICLDTCKPVVLSIVSVSYFPILESPAWR